MSDSILFRLKSLISEQMPDSIGNTSIEDDTPLFEGGLNLDSIAAIQLISLTEAYFGVQYEEQDLSEEYFKTPRTLADLLRRRGATED